MNLLRVQGHVSTVLKAASLAAIAATSLPASANLIVNGSFEEPTVPIGSFTNFSGGSTSITGWTVVGVDTAIVSGSFSQSGITFQAQSGVQWADLAGVTSNSTTSGLSQDIATVVGHQYELSFFVGSALDSVFFFPTAIDLSIDGGTRTTYANPNAPRTNLDWMQFTVQFVATKTDTNLTFFNAAASNNFNSAFDNVSLIDVTRTVPEPGSLLLVGIGLAGMLGGNGRRR